MLQDLRLRDIHLPPTPPLAPIAATFGPYSVIGDAPRIFYDMYAALCHGTLTDLPADARDMLLVFIPKGDEATDTGSALAHT